VASDSTCWRLLDAGRHRYPDDALAVRPAQDRWSRCQAWRVSDRV